MSRIGQALLLDTDDERLAWLESLTPMEREQVFAEARHIIDAMENIRKEVTAWMTNAQTFFANLGSSTAMPEKFAVFVEYASFDKPPETFWDPTYQGGDLEKAREVYENISSKHRWNMG